MFWSQRKYFVLDTCTTGSHFINAIPHVFPVNSKNKMIVNNLLKYVTGLPVTNNLNFLRIYEKKQISPNCLPTNYNIFENVKYSKSCKMEIGKVFCTPSF